MNKYLTNTAKERVRKSFQNSFKGFFIQGFVMANLGMLCGIAYCEGFQSKFILYYYMFQPLFCMIVTFLVSFDLFYKGCRMLIKDFLHYLYAGIYVSSFGLGVLYFKIPTLVPVILIAGVYLVVCALELIYWKFYIKTYFKDFVYRFVIALKALSKNI